MKIRKATVADSQDIATCILLAMGDIIYQFIGCKDDVLAKEFMLSFVSKGGNQYSYENCWVAEEDHGIIAAACIYDGAALHRLRTPVLDYVKSKYGMTLILEDETQEAEMYIDCLGVDVHQQGKGIGSEMLRFLIKEYVVNRHQILGLLVDEDNQAAKRLYLSLGFMVMGNKTFAGKKMEHLQIGH
ncbi:GNAT family N-acetyltransferase [Pedobacter sp. AW31-3R]|uniref:GNAT family N-acetyltransferase n=1 Tax=Pedobacter sp. AW31-3R TaxID=3445781 RepID=UPI003FA07D78